MEIAAANSGVRGLVLNRWGTALVLAGASVALSQASVIDARSPGLNELRINRLPRPALRLADLA